MSWVIVYRTFKGHVGLVHSHNENDDFVPTEFGTKEDAEKEMRDGSDNASVFSQAVVELP